MKTQLRRASLFIILGSLAITIAGCAKKLVGNTYQSGNGQFSVTFSSETKADVKRNGQEIDDIDYTRNGNTITLKTRAFGDMTVEVQPDGNLKLGAISLVLKP